MQSQRHGIKEKYIRKWTSEASMSVLTALQEGMGSSSDQCPNLLHIGLYRNMLYTGKEPSTIIVEGHSLYCS